MGSKGKTWTLSEGTKKKMSLGWLKRKQRADYQDYIDKVKAVGRNNKGKVHSDETRKKMSISHKLKPLRYWLGKKNLEVSGEKHWAWKGGITPLKIRLRKSADYKRWRKAVYERDGYACVLCGDNKGGNLNADHNPVPFWKLLQNKDYATMWNVNNGRTLCELCHASETIRLDIHRANQPIYAQP